MYKRIILLLTLLLAPVVGAFSQLMPVLNVPSPEVGGLAEYGTIPVGLYTGIPDISIPLHEMKAGGLSFPITAGYHLASIKPQAQEGSMGLGWSLQAGGYISRSVNALCDEMSHSNGYSPGFYAQAHRLKGITNEQFAAETKNIHPLEGTDTYYELSADEFSFSFFGYSGTFYYNEDNGWTVISDQDIRVEFNPANGEGFVDLAGLRPEINTDKWGRRSYNNRFFNKFTLVTPDGCRYEFGGINATEYSISYYNRNSSDLIASTWQLSKITTPENRVIAYTYEAQDLICDLRYVPQSKKVYGIGCSASNPSYGHNAMTGFLLMPVRLAKIITPDEEISLTYFNELNYGLRFWPDALAWLGDDYYPTEIYHFSQYFNRLQFDLFMPTGLDYLNEGSLQRSVAENLNHSVLHRISIQSRNDATYARSIYFDYTFNERRKLSVIAQREGIPELLPYYVEVHGVKYLNGYNTPPLAVSDHAPEYKFNYNKTDKMPYDYIVAETDYWGYYVGTNISFAKDPAFTKPQPSLKYSQAEILTDIIYPTGGQTHFEYELNDYSKAVNVAHTKLDAHFGFAGGLRVSSVSRKRRDGSLLDKKKYYYAESKSAGSASSGILKALPTYTIQYATSTQALDLQSQGGYFASATNLNSPTIGYSCVIEETLNNSGVSQGYIKYRYSNYDTDVYGNAHLDEPALYSNASGESIVKPFSSRSVERGKLLTEEYYDSAGRLLKKNRQHYKVVNAGEFKSAHQDAVFFCTDPDALKVAYVGTLARVYTYSYLPDTIVVTEYPSEGIAPGYSIERAQAYDSHKLLKQEKILTGTNILRTVDYTYPADCNNLQWMVSAHQLSPIVEKKTMENGRLLKEIYEYGYADTKLGAASYLKTAIQEFGNWNKRIGYQVQITDSYANPVAVKNHGVDYVYLWSYEGRQLIARIENATYNKVKSLLGELPEDFSRASQPDNATYLLIEGIRHKLPKARVFIYKYTPNMQIESATAPDGQTVFYKYDYLNRLREEYIYEKGSGVLLKKLLNVYDYHYQY